MDASKDSLRSSNDSVKIFAKEVSQVEQDGSYFLASIDEAIGVEYLLAEPGYDDCVDGILNFDKFNVKCFNSEEILAAEDDYLRKDNNELDSSLYWEEKTKSELLGGDFLDGMNNLVDGCEDYLLDPEFNNDVPEQNDVPRKRSCMENLNLDQCTNPAERDSITEVSQPSVASSMALKKCDQSFLLLDKMAVHELHETFKKIFGCETAATDRHWLKHRISSGLQNLNELENGLSFLSHIVSSNENDEQNVLLTSDENPLKTSIPFTGVFNFKTKPRVRRVKRGWHSGWDILKTSSFEVGKVVYGFHKYGETDNVIRSRKRWHRANKRYIQESIQHSKYPRRKHENSDPCSEHEILCIGSNGKHCKAVKATSLSCSKKPSKRACIQVPFGLPIEKGRPKEKGLLSDDYDRIPLSSNVGSGMESYSGDSEDDMSEDGCVPGVEICRGKQRRKNHTLWSLPEVLKLVEGVSTYGVGRWTDIKRLLFPSSVHRTSVDLKDKWRNLLKASSKSQQKKRGIQRKRKPPQAIPQNILHRVRELALTYPYPRARVSKSPGTVTTAQGVASTLS